MKKDTRLPIESILYPNDLAYDYYGEGTSDAGIERKIEVLERHANKVTETINVLIEQYNKQTRP